MWLSPLNYTWATDDHIALARGLLRRYNLSVASLGGWFGSTPDEFERSCQIAVALGAPILGGGTSMLKKDRPLVIARLKQHGLKFGLENHPEKTPQEVLDQIGSDGEDVLGATVDTGWFGTQGYDAARAIEELGPYVFHVHLKDVKAAGAHETCRYGEGVVPIEGCVRALKQIGYQGAISVEHEPHHVDPTDDIRASAEMAMTFAEAQERSKPPSARRWPKSFRLCGVCRRPRPSRSLCRAAKGWACCVSPEA